MRNILVRLLGWRAVILQGDPLVTDRWKWLATQLQPGPLRTLDAGCGSGGFTLYAAKIGNEALGLSFDQNQVNRGLARAKILGIHSVAFREMDLRKLDEFADSLGLASFDQIIVFETIEHILNDQKLVNDLASLLKPGGTILLTTPYTHHHPFWGEKLSEIEDGGHVRWGYTHADLEAIFERAGLQVVNRAYISGLVSQKIASCQFMLSGLDPRLGWLLAFPLRVFHPLDRLLTRLTKYPHLSVGIVGRKPGEAS